MNRISDWYTSIGDLSFPTVFVRLSPDEIACLLRGDSAGDVAQGTMERIRCAMVSLPGASFVGADCCAPTDSPQFGQTGRVTSAALAYQILATSTKVRTALEKGLTDRLTVRPFRRMDTVREFRMFFWRRTLVAMSQYNLARHFRRLAGRQEEIWRRGQEMAARIGRFLPNDNQVVDVYLCSDATLMIVDLNAWGEGTDSKLLRTWDRNWDETVGLKLIPPPVAMKGDVSVSF